MNKSIFPRINVVKTRIFKNIPIKPDTCNKSYSNSSTESITNIDEHIHKIFKELSINFIPIEDDSGSVYSCSITYSKSFIEFDVYYWKDTESDNCYIIEYRRNSGCRYMFSTLIDDVIEKFNSTGLLKNQTRRKSLPLGPLPFDV